MKPRKAGSLLLSILIATTAWAQSLDPQGLEETPRLILPEDLKLTMKGEAAADEQRISLSVRNIDIIEALKFFSIKSGLNIVPTQKVSGRVTLTVENVPVKDVFDIMLRSNSLAYEKKGDIYNVMTEQEYKLLFGKNFSDTRKVQMFRLKYAIPDQAFPLLEAIKSEIGRLLVEPESGTVMLIDTPEKIAAAQKALEGMEQESSVKIFSLKYAKAKDVEDQLKNQLDLKKVGSIKADDRTNQVIVQTFPERMKKIEMLIEGLDKKTKAVLIDVKILKIKLSDRLDTGIQWEGLFNIAKQYGMAYIGSYPFSNMTGGITNPTFSTRSEVLESLGGQVGSYPFSGTTSSLNSSAKIAPGKNMHIGIVDAKRDFDMVINYIKTLGKSKIIASPSLAVVNNQEAKVHIGERRAYITTTTTTGTSTTTVAEEVTYVDVGVRLSLIPMINDDGYVTIKVKPEISSVIGYVTSSSNNAVPIIDTNSAETTVIAKDGSTIIIGGLGREEKIESSEQVPFLGSIPFLGFFFRNKTQTVEHTELVIMLTPIIFEGDRFITTKDADKFAVKPVKAFDVFRPETQGRPETTQGFMQVQEVFIPLSDEFSVKGAKSYDEAMTHQNIRLKANTEQAPLLTPLKEGVMLKDFKSYN
ncbi:MAG: secretin N-terminal domain-containing protein [Candidatus Omnitrophota bacterium]